MKKLFGTDGIRGHADAFPLDDATVATIGRSLARQMTEKLGRAPRFVTGRDTRESGERIEAALHAGITEAGGEAESAGVITTPGVAFLTGHYDFDAGIVVSASHNPYFDNGIKIFAPNGKKIDKATEETIEADIAAAAGNIVAEQGETLHASRADEFRRAYLEHLRRGLEGFDLSGCKVVIDCANGAACGLAPALFESFGANVIAIHNEPDGKNINENCGSLHLDDLRKAVIAEGADFGVAFDGDADRALFVDEEGNIVDGDGVLWIMSKYLQDSGALENRSVVATVMSNIGLEIALASRNIKLIRAAVGDKYVLDELLKTNSEIGGEQSGHIIFPKRSLVGDGMMTALLVFNAIRSNNSTFSSMIKGFTRYPQILVNVKVREKQPFESVAEISAAATSVQDELDGHGRLLLRYSGTENLARVMIEGKDQHEIEVQANRLAEVISARLG